MNIRKHYTSVLNVISWFILINYLFLIYSTFKIDYLGRPELIGPKHLPVDLFSEDMLYIYKHIIVYTFFFLSGLGIILLKKWGWYLSNLVFLIDFMRYIYYLTLDRFLIEKIIYWEIFLLELGFLCLVLHLINSKEVKERFNIKFTLPTFS